MRVTVGWRGCSYCIFRYLMSCIFSTCIENLDEICDIQWCHTSPLCEAICGDFCWRVLHAPGKEDTDRAEVRRGGEEEISEMFIHVSFCKALWDVMRLYDMIWHDMIRCDVIWYDMIWCNIYTYQYRCNLTYIIWCNLSTTKINWSWYIFSTSKGSLGFHF